MSEQPEVEIPDADETATEEKVSDWEFRHVPPTVDDVRRLLETLPDAYGVRYVDYLDYVQALPQDKKITRKVKMPNGSIRKEDEYIATWALYMGVAGRVKMLNDVAWANGWAVDFEPEPVTPTGIPGMLDYGKESGRIVYREYLTVTPYTEGKRDDAMGRRPGTAWVPYSGGKQAAGSNPVEKVETSARGRAIAAWGIGVLPGSGIASLEEMQGAAANERAMRQEAGPQQQETQTRKSREELVEEVLTTAEQVRQTRGLDDDVMKQRLVSFLSEKLGVVSVYDAETGQIDWLKPKPGQIQLLLTSLVDALRVARNEQSDL